LYSQIDGGGEFIKDNKAAFNNEPARKAAQVLVDLRDKGLWPKNISDESAYDLFKTGKAAVHFAGVWATGNYESNKDLHFAAVPLPKIFDKEATWGDSHTLIIPKQDNKEKEIAAAKFANWLTSDGIDWAAAGHVPSKTTVTESSEFKALKYRPDYAKAIETVNYYPQITNISGVTDAVIADFVAMMKGNLTVDQTINKAAEDVNAILAK
jgi:multiple sugar transport system substrate-binding protein